MPRNFTDFAPEEFDEDHFQVETLKVNEEKNMEKFSWKKELKSFAITFLVGFFIVIYEQLNDFTLEAFKNGAYVGAVLGAVRSGLKAVIEMFLRLYSNRNS